MRHFALSFTNCAEDVRLLRELVGPESTIISKIESKRGVRNLDGILRETDEILIDRGDLLRTCRRPSTQFVVRRPRCAPTVGRIRCRESYTIAVADCSSAAATNARASGESSSARRTTTSSVSGAPASGR